MKGKLSTLIAVAVILGLLGAACAPKPAPEKVLKIGLQGPFTGPNARVGEEFWDAATMAFDAINWKIGDYKVEMVKIDCESDPEKATRAYEEAIVRGKIEAGIINWHSSVAVALMEVVAKHKIPHFFGFGATGLVNEKYESDPQKYSYWMGKTWAEPSKLSIAYVETLEAAIKKGIWEPAKKVAAIYGEDTDWGRSFGKAIRGQLEDVGWQVTGEDYFAMAEVEFYPLLTKWKEQGVVLIAGTATAPASFAALVKQAREVGLNAYIVADGLGWTGEWYQLAGDASDYVLDQIPQWTTPEAKKFRDDFEKRWNIAPSPSAAGQAYDMTNFFIKLAKAALKEYGKLDRETLYKIGQDKLWKGELTYMRADGAIIHEQYKYIPETIPDPIVGVGYYIFPVIQYFGGQGKIVWPDVWKEADLGVPPYMK
ncbi:MAG: branched-chain amino acid ABC transporter substrate-binding protein [Chloroflexi bacterium]|nr:branched-chain amino acid ABC transporter substrate-binding protein [Chloroflexota bacterium]